MLLAQIVLGFGLSPLIVRSLKDFPWIGQGLGPVASELLLIVVAGWLIQRNLKANDTDEKRFFRYIAKPDQFLLVGAVTLGSLIGGVALNQFANPSLSPSNAADVASAVDLYEPFTMLGTGLATSLLSPWIEERIYRGVILQGLLPYVGAPLAVLFPSLYSHLAPYHPLVQCGYQIQAPRDKLPFHGGVEAIRCSSSQYVKTGNPMLESVLQVVISAGVFAGSHLTATGFPNLFLFGLALGTAHVVSGKNLLVPTAAHSAYNMFVFLAVIVTVSHNTQ